MTRDKSGRTSAGILLYRRDADGVRVLVAHPGGPFWVGRDAGHWTIPKGEAGPGEELLDVARREFREETGTAAPDGDPIPLGEVFQKSGKRVVAWALEGDLDAAAAVSNTFEMEWPPGSGRVEVFPEIDRVAWLDPDGARVALKAAQLPFLERLMEELGARE
jgi:predicted NUDIX family NTP pyrophosphohydrolase